MTPKYRSDIDGLRAVAIVPVVLFHLGLSHFRGGFVGVDVFFVISGFLITSVIGPEMLAGRFSVLTFYERRVRRLFPAFFTVMATCTALALVLFLPPDLRSFSDGLTATTIFGANLFFWKTANYFHSAAEANPFLHAWSLSVEEQFYIFFPPLLLLTVRFARRRTKVVLGVLAVLSFAASLIAVNAAPTAAFYLPQFRAWELLLGALLAVGAFPPTSSRVLREALSLLGLGLIAVSVLSLSPQTPFPGINALWPSLGTALVIYAGTDGYSQVNRALGLRPLVLIGLGSYSLYLWHWPLIVFARYSKLADLTDSEMVLVVMLSSILALLSWRFVERPFRGRSRIVSRQALFGLSAVIMVAFVSIGLLGHSQNGFPSRFPPEVVRLAAPAGERIPFHSPRCFGVAPESVASGRLCHLGRGDGPSFVLWGDSHALALAPAVDQVARGAVISGFLAASPACPPLLGVERYDQEGSGSCRAFNAAVTRLIRMPKIRTVVLAARWALNAEGTRYGSEDGAPAALSPEGIRGNPRVFREGLERTLRFLNESGKEVVVLTQVPEIGWPVPSVLARARVFHWTAPSGPSLAQYHRRQQVVDAVLRDLSARYDFRIADCSRSFCSSSGCIVVKQGWPLYRDEHHLSVAGSLLAANSLVGIFK